MKYMTVAGVDLMLEMMSDALTKAGKSVAPNIACAHSQQYTKDSVF